jgi:hypothetical protein
MSKKKKRKEVIVRNNAHVWALFKDMTKEDKEEFIKGAEEAGF